MSYKNPELINNAVEKDSVLLVYLYINKNNDSILNNIAKIVTEPFKFLRTQPIEYIRKRKFRFHCALKVLRRLQVPHKLRCSLVKY